MALALALKYRPRTFDDLIGQQAVSQTLSLALESQNISHAYLFSGLRGSGKTSSARIFARSLICDNGPTAHPCGECDNCKAALDDRHIDIREMDGASNRKIDDVRELIEQTKYAPSMARFKIFIIDEVHMLTREAFNALLKTLEEPPSYVKFILATTDPLKVPATILSRTQHFRFKQIPQHLVIAHIANILDKENVSYEQNALNILARSGNGSLRDTLTLLDQAIIFCKNHINIADITQMLGIVDPVIFSNLFDGLLNSGSIDLQQSLQILGEYECGAVLDEMALYLKDRLLDNDVRFTPILMDRFFRILADSKSLLFLNADGEFVLMLALMKMQEALKIKDIDLMIQDLEAQILGVDVKSLNSQKSANIDNAAKEQPKIESANFQNLNSQNMPNSANANFERLIAKIYDRSFDLGEIFKKSIEFVSFENDTLTWISNVSAQDRDFLMQHFEIIKMLAKEVFGANTKIQAQKNNQTNQIQNLNSQNLDSQNMPDSAKIVQNLDSENLNSQNELDSQNNINSENQAPADPQELQRAQKQKAFDQLAQNQPELLKNIQALGIKKIIIEPHIQADSEN